MAVIKKSDTSVNFAFADQHSTNKLQGRNISTEVAGDQVTLSIDMAHYAKRRTSTPEDTDFLLLTKMAGNTQTVTINNQTVLTELLRVPPTRILVDVGADVSVEMAILSLEQLGSSIAFIKVTPTP